LLYKESLQDGIEIVKNHADSVIWIKLDKDFFHLHDDVYICGGYLWGEESPAYNTVNIDFFDILEEDMTYFSDLGEVFIAGDFNSRTGLRNDFIPHDRLVLDTDQEDYVPDLPISRASLDSKSNNFGTRLLDLCKSSALRIVNGRLDDDYNKGMYTFLCNSGASVVDYLLTRERNFSCIESFAIQPFNEWSDHAPLRFSLFSRQANMKMLTRVSQNLSGVMIKRSPFARA